MIFSAKIEDYPQLQEIWESAVLATHDFLAEEDFDFYKSRLIFYFENLSLYVYKDNVDSEIKGFIGVNNKKIEMLFIHDKYRGGGIGKKLLLYAIQDLKTDKVDVNEQNKAALQFYNHFGFTVYNHSDIDSEGKNYPILYLKKLI